MSKLEKYSKSRFRFEQWIKEMEEVFQENLDSNAELGEMNRLIEKYKVITIKN